MENIDTELLKGILIGVLTGIVSTFVMNWCRNNFNLKDSRRVVSFNFKYDMEMIRRSFYIRVHVLYFYSAIFYLCIILLCDKINIFGCGALMGLIIGVVLLYYWRRFTYCILYDEISSRYENIDTKMCEEQARSINKHSVKDLLNQILLLTSVYILYTSRDSVTNNDIIIMTINVMIIVTEPLLEIIFMIITRIQNSDKRKQRITKEYYNVFIVSNLEYQKFKLYLRNGAVHNLKLNEEVIVNKKYGLLVKSSERVVYYNRDEIAKIVDHVGNTVRF